MAFSGARWLYLTLFPWKRASVQESWSSFKRVKSMSIKAVIKFASSYNIGQEAFLATKRFFDLVVLDRGRTIKYPLEVGKGFIVVSSICHNINSHRVGEFVGKFIWRLSKAWAIFICVSVVVSRCFDELRWYCEFSRSRRRSWCR